jgi:hypothetical protein
VTQDLSYTTEERDILVPLKESVSNIPSPYLIGLAQIGTAHSHLN